MSKAITVVFLTFTVLGISLLGTAYYIQKVSKPMQKGIQCLVDDRFCNR